MQYRDIIKELAANNEIDLSVLADRVGMKPNTLYQRLKESWNPRVKDMQPLLEALGYEMVFVPIGAMESNQGLKKHGYRPEFPEKSSVRKNSEK